MLLLFFSSFHDAKTILKNSENVKETKKFNARIYNLYNTLGYRYADIYNTIMILQKKTENKLCTQDNL